MSHSQQKRNKELAKENERLRHEVEILRAVVDEIHNKPPQERQYCRGCSLIANAHADGSAASADTVRRDVGGKVDP